MAVYFTCRKTGHLRSLKGLPKEIIKEGKEKHKEDDFTLFVIVTFMSSESQWPTSTPPILLPLTSR
jgi:hypothetical protein